MASVRSGTLTISGKVNQSLSIFADEPIFALHINEPRVRSLKELLEDIKKVCKSKISRIGLWIQYHSLGIEDQHAIITFVSSFPDLRYLDLRNNMDWPSYFAPTIVLELLRLHRPLEYIYLQSTRMNDEGLRAISSFITKTLVEVSLVDTRPARRGADAKAYDNELMQLVKDVRERCHEFTLSAFHGAALSENMEDQISNSDFLYSASHPFSGEKTSPKAIVQALYNSMNENQIYKVWLQKIPSGHLEHVKVFHNWSMSNSNSILEEVKLIKRCGPRAVVLCRENLHTYDCEYLEPTDLREGCQSYLKILLENRVLFPGLIVETSAKSIAVVLYEIDADVIILSPFPDSSIITENGGREMIRSSFRTFKTTRSSICPAVRVQWSENGPCFFPWKSVALHKLLKLQHDSENAVSFESFERSELLVSGSLSSTEDWMKSSHNLLKVSANKELKTPVFLSENPVLIAPQFPPHRDTAQFNSIEIFEPDPIRKSVNVDELNHYESVKVVLFSHESINRGLVLQPAFFVR